MPVAANSTQIAIRGLERHRSSEFFQHLRLPPLPRSIHASNSAPGPNLRAFPSARVGAAMIR